MRTKLSVNHPRHSSSYPCHIEEVTICPVCKHSIKPIKIHGQVIQCHDETYKVSILYLCNACNNTFLCQFNEVVFNKDNAYCTSPDIVAPNKFIEEVFDVFINDVSPVFIEIYNQALAAECADLEQIAGIGYRKALEFLIKDFLILKNPDNKTSIEKTPLGSCVNNFIDNPQLKAAASRAVWLGNDQTHYIQKFTDKDISDLKRLVRLTVHWISMILETEEVEKIEPIK